MNPGAPPLPGTKTSARSASGYNQKALAEIRNILQPFANSSSNGESSHYQATQNVGGAAVSSEVAILQNSLTQLLSVGYDGDTAGRALKATGGKYDGGLNKLTKSDNINGPMKDSPLSALGTKLIRKPSLERELNLHRGSPALDSGAGSSRSDSPRLSDTSHPHDKSSRQYSPSFRDNPPLPPPRCSSTPPPPPPPHSMQQLLKRRSPAPPLSAAATAVAAATRVSNQSPSSPTPRQPMIVQNGSQAQQQLTQQIQALNIYPSSNPELPPPYPMAGPPPPPPYAVSIQNRQSPTQSHQDYRKSPSSGIYSGGTSAGSPSPITVFQSVGNPTPTPTSMARPTPLQAWGARQAKTPIIMQSVKSTQVQKPILQTAIAPVTPQSGGAPSPSHSPSPSPLQPLPPPSYASSIQQKQQAPSYPTSPKPPSPTTAHAPPIAANTPSTNNCIPLIPTTEPPSYAMSMALAIHRHQLPPPPPYGNQQDDAMSVMSSQASHKKFSANKTNNSRPNSQQSASSADGPCQNSSPYMSTPPLPPTSSSSVAKKNLGVNGCVTSDKVRHQSPIPLRKRMSKEKEAERQDSKVKNYSPQAFKFFMEQHIENVFKSYKQRMYRRTQLENEMAKIKLPPQSQIQMRKMLYQKESNYIRLKRAKMDKSMFTKIKAIGVGAFGEVTLVRKNLTNHVYAMKTLRKTDVLKRNQVAHVKAERDILAEADNEWVVKLYYSFQDKDNLYFVMDYIAGGDLMSLLIKLGVFEEKLAKFYIAELTCAVESVHKMGFIHRDIKPDNILIDKGGHIKLTDFGLCTGFRWTHNSKYYQRNEAHSRQDSMEPDGEECRCKPLERRRQREHQRCMAHSLVGTPNYIAPEVLQRTGYSQLCDWWSVGVILYEMLVGSPPFLASTPAETQSKVINWQKTLHIPASAQLSKESTDLILKLCSGADKRLGKDANEVKRHSFFKDVDFGKGFRSRPAPYIPKVQFDTDTSNFDPIDPDRLRNSGNSASNISDNEMLGDDKTSHGFFEFTFRRFFDDDGPNVYANRISLDDAENQGPVYV